MALTELKIRNLKPRKTRYMVCDGQGLYIAIQPTGEKYWYYRIWENGRERKVSLGRYPDIGLKEARELKHAMKDKRRETPVIFKVLAEEWFMRRYAPARAERTIQLARSRLERYLYPVFGGRDVKSITPQELLKFLVEVQEKSVETGHRLKNIVSQVYRFGIAKGVCSQNPASDITGALTPKRTDTHYSTIRTAPQAAELLRAVIGYDKNHIVRLALLTLAYTFVRPGEVCRCEWTEIDFNAAEWRIPAEKMKMRREHIVPLSTQAVSIFREAQNLTGSGRYVFSLERDGSVSPSAPVLSGAMRRLGYGKGKATPHSFRGMASTLLNENGWPADVIERQLAHIEGNAVRAAYNHAEYLPERRRMMQWWADYLDRLALSGS